MLWKSMYKIFPKENFNFLPWNFPQKYSSANKSLLGSGGTFNTLNITLLFCVCLRSTFDSLLILWIGWVSAFVIHGIEHFVSWKGVCRCWHWLKCCSVRLKTAAVAGRVVFEHGEMEAFGNGHKNCHVESTLLNTSKWAVGWDLKWRGLICCHSRAGSYKECPHLWSTCLVLFCLVQIQG